jgi:alkylation response protein AidB-like acyl-CoA dehydrogenase
MIAKGTNDRLKERILPHTHNGDRLIGIGFSQLRRPGPAVLRAEYEEGGFTIDGHIPWITGFGFFGEVLIGAQLPDGRAVFGLIPFQPEEGISYSKPMKLAAMEAAQTVTADLTGWFLPAHDVVDIKPAGWIMRNDMINITLQGFFAIGCARAGIDVVREQGIRRDKTFISEAADALEREVHQCRERLQAAQAMGEETTEEKLQLRAWAIDLAGRCAHAAVTASGGAANSRDHSAQRILREALVFTVSAQTEPIQKATLERFVRN